MPRPFFDRKVATYFKLHDANHDGFISLKEFTDLADRQSDAAKANAAEREKLKACFIKVWRMWMKSAGSDDKGLLTAAIMTESLKQLRNDAEFKQAYTAICQDFFKLLDSDGDGFLQKDDYAKSLANIGFDDPEVASRVFEAMDTKKEGKLALKEFCYAFLEYLTSEDEKSPFALLWGPLVE